MLKMLINDYGIVIFPFLLLTAYSAYESMYELVLETWCVAYGIIY